MKEVRDIIAAFDEAVLAGKNTALATVVHVEGSSYRRPGARMLVTDDGMITGAVSGGCLEGDALRKALFAITAKQNKLVTYDTTDEEDAKFGVQLGCNGIVYILFEPIRVNEKNNPIELLKKALDLRKNAALLTLFSLAENIQIGTCYFMVENEQHIALDVFIDADKNLQQKIVADIDIVFEKKISLMKIYQTSGQAQNVFIQFLSPPINLIIVGAGNDVLPLVTIAQILGWDITIVDGRITHANQQRFPMVKNIIVTKPENIAAFLNIDNWTVALLMTHNYNYDLAVLKQIYNKGMLYLGVLGPKLKMQRMYDDLLKDGLEMSNTDRAAIYAPIGLDIGAETAEEIALSAVAEIKAVLMGKNAAFLRNKALPIHL